MLDFAHAILTKHPERPTIVVIEAAGWYNSGGKDCRNDRWTRLANPNFFKYRNILHFDTQRSYDRAAPAFTMGGNHAALSAVLRREADQ